MQEDLVRPVSTRGNTSCLVRWKVSKRRLRTQSTISLGINVMRRWGNQNIIAVLVEYSYVHAVPVATANRRRFVGELLDLVL